MTYEDVAGDLDLIVLMRFGKAIINLQALTKAHPTEVKNFRINYLMNESKTSFRIRAKNQDTKEILV